MPVPQTIFDEVLEEFLRRLDAEPELDPDVVKRLQSLLRERRNCRVEDLQSAMRKGESWQ